MKINIFDNEDMLIEYLKYNKGAIQILDFSKSKKIKRALNNKIIFPYNFSLEEKHNLLEEYIETIFDLGKLNNYSLYWLCHPISEKNDLIPSNLFSQITDFLSFYRSYSALGGHELAYLALCACVGVASSDTLASEIGSLDPRTRIITSLAAVPAGTNGGMSPTGTIAAFYGGLIIAIISTLLGAFNGDATPPIFLFLAVTVIGWIGCQIDSLLGALLENKGYLGKHGVNFISTFSGSLLSLYAVYIFL